MRHIQKINRQEYDSEKLMKAKIQYKRDNGRIIEDWNNIIMYIILISRNTKKQNRC